MYTVAHSQELPLATFSKPRIVRKFILTFSYNHTPPSL